MKGKLILVVGPSGSGKGALMDYVREKRPDIIFPVSCTTREPRAGEVEGEMYYFVSDKTFDEKIAHEEFVEWARYGGNRYGTLKSEIMKPLEEGKIVVREIEVQGARQMQKIIPKENLRIIFIDAGAWENLERRILARAALSREELKKRQERYEDERTIMNDAFVAVKNFDGGLERAKEDFLAAIHDAAQ